MTSVRPDLGLSAALRQRFSDGIQAVFTAMDAAYDAASDHHGFQCTGCADNCCETRFTHHTLLEVLFLMEGVGALDADLRKAAVKRAEDVVSAMHAHDATGVAAVSFRAMCPLNESGKCMTYAHRPMICRLHGIPWKMAGRSGDVTGPGCGLFDETATDTAVHLDRTPFYRDLAGLEMELRQTTGFGERIRLTIAEILTAPMPEWNPEGA